MGTVFSLHDKNQLRVVQIIVEVTATISAISSLVVIIAYIVLKAYREFHLRLILYLIFSGFLCSICYFLRYTLYGIDSNLVINGREVLCNVLDTALQASLISNFLWTSCICHMLYQVIHRHNDRVSKYEIFYHLICWGTAVAFVIGLIVKTTTENNCSKYRKILSKTRVFFGTNLIPKKEERGIIEIVLYSFYPVLIFVIAYNLVMLFILNSQLKHEMEENDESANLMGSYKRKSSKLQRSFRLFLLIFLICNPLL